MPGVDVILYSNRRDLYARILLQKPKRKYVHRCLDTKDLAEALQKTTAVFMEVVQEPDKFSRTKVQTLNKLADLYIQQETDRVRRKEITEGTLKGRERVIYDAVLPFCAVNKLETVSDIKHNSFLNYGASRVDSGYSQSTVEIDIRHLKSFLFYCQKQHGYWKGFEWLVPVPRKVKGGPKPNSAFTDEMIAEMTEYLERKTKNEELSRHQRWRWQLFSQYFTLLLDSGARSSEPAHIQWKHVRVRGFDPTIPASILAAECDVHIPVSKTGPRDTVFSSPVFILLKKMYSTRGIEPTPEDYVFLNVFNRKQLSVQGFNSKFKEMHADLGYGPQFTMYSTRSTYISDKIIQGAPLSLISQNCGNSARVIEQSYQDIILKRNAAVLLERKAFSEESKEFLPLV